VWGRAAALTELVRGRLCLVGPTSADELARSLAIDTRDADAALLALESEGVVLRGRFSAQSAGIEWCDRALLARIHRYTLTRLRAEIEPVSPADFMRFLFRWQHVDPADRLAGLDGLREALIQLDGFELAGAAWERSVLPGRVEGYDPSMLDMLCFAGEVGWARVSPRSVALAEPAQLTPATPVAVFQRDHSEAWQALRRVADDPERRLTDNARRVLDVLRGRGASFFNDVRSASGLDAEDTRRGLGTLVASGLAASDGFSGLRALLVRASGRPIVRDRRASFAGRWSTIPTPHLAAEDSAVIETEAWALLRRYGVVFHRLLTRESIVAPWRDLARAYRRLEARGEIRGGRFVSGMSGEQFAMPEAIERLREVRRAPGNGRLLTIGTADPLNLAGIVTSGDRVRSTARNRMAYRDGVPVAVMEGGIVRMLAALDAPAQHEVASALRTRRAAASIA
jgi:ATP-dependent Lhr-like helicase